MEELFILWIILCTAAAGALIAAASYLCYRIAFTVPRKKIAGVHDFPEDLHYGDQAGKIHALIDLSQNSSPLIDRVLRHTI